MARPRQQAANLNVSPRLPRRQTATPPTRNHSVPRYHSNNPGTSTYLPSLSELSVPARRLRRPTSAPLTSKPRAKLSRRARPSARRPATSSPGRMGGCRRWRSARRRSRGLSFTPILLRGRKGQPRPANAKGHADEKTSAQAKTEDKRQRQADEGLNLFGKRYFMTGKPQSWNYCCDSHQKRPRTNGIRNKARHEMCLTFSAANKRRAAPFSRIRFQRAPFLLDGSRSPSLSAYEHTRTPSA